MRLIIYGNYLPPDAPPALRLTVSEIARLYDDRRGPTWCGGCVVVSNIPLSVEATS